MKLPAKLDLIAKVILPGLLLKYLACALLHTEKNIIRNKNIKPGNTGCCSQRKYILKVEVASNFFKTAIFCIFNKSIFGVFSSKNLSHVAK